MTQKPNRGPRSPGYPSVSLHEALERAEVLRQYSPARKPIPVDTALTQWGYGVKSGAGLQLLASLKKFGLLEDQGRKDQRSVKLTELAWRILTEPREAEPSRIKAVRDAALSPKIHTEIHDRWSAGLPSDTAVRVWLIQEKKFNEKAVPSFLRDLKATFEYAGLSGPAAIREEAGQEETGDGAHQADVEADGHVQRQESAPPPAPRQNTTTFSSAPPEGSEEHRWKLPGGTALVLLPSKMTARDFMVLRGQIDLLELTLGEDDNQPHTE